MVNELDRIRPKALLTALSPPLSPGELSSVEIHRISTKAMLAALCPYKRRYRSAAPTIRARVLGTLMMSRNVCFLDDLIEAVYGEDPDGGTVNPRTNIAQQVMRLRREGYPIETHYARGYRLRAG